MSLNEGEAPIFAGKETQRKTLLFPPSPYMRFSISRLRLLSHKKEEEKLRFLFFSFAAANSRSCQSSRQFAASAAAKEGKIRNYFFSAGGFYGRAGFVRVSPISPGVVFQEKKDRNASPLVSTTAHTLHRQQPIVKSSLVLSDLLRTIKVPRTGNPVKLRYTAMQKGIAAKGKEVP